MAAVVASCWQTNPLESQRTSKTHLFFLKLREKIVKQTDIKDTNKQFAPFLSLSLSFLSYLLICLFQVVLPQGSASGSVRTIWRGLFLKQSRNQHIIARSRKKDPPGGREGVEVALDLGDAVLQGQQPLPQESLKDRSHARPAGRQSSLFGLKDIKEWVCGGSWDKPTTKIVQFAKKQPMDEGQRVGRRTNTNTDTNTHISTKQIPWTPTPPMPTCGQAGGQRDGSSSTPTQWSGSYFGLLGTPGGKSF